MTSVQVKTQRGGYRVALPDLDVRMLPAVWRLVAPGPNGVVDDVEKLCAGVLAEVMRREGRADNTIDRDDVMRHLLGEVVVLHHRYDPTKRTGSGTFAGYLYDRLRFRLIDYWRAQYGRNGEKRVPDLPDVVGDGDGPVDPVGGVAAEGPGDRAEDWADAVEWLHDRPDSATLRAERELGLEQDRGAQVGDRGERPRITGSTGAPPVAPHARAAWVDCRECRWRTYRDSSGGPRFPSVCNGCGSVLAAPSELSGPAPTPAREPLDTFPTTAEEAIHHAA